MADKPEFKHLSMNLPEEEELVIHAGSPGKRAERAGETLPEPSSAADEASKAPADEEAPDAAQAPEAPEPPEHSADEQDAEPKLDARHAELKRRAEELAAAEEGLKNPHTMQRMQITVLLALAAIVVFFVVYTVLTAQ